MMYGKIETAFWTERRFRGLAGPSREALTYLLSSPHGNHIGLYHLPAAYMAQDAGWTIEATQEALQRLQCLGFVKYDWQEEVVFIPLYGEWNPIKGNNMDTAACADVGKLPSTPLIRDWLVMARAMYPGMAAKLDAIEEETDRKHVPMVFEPRLDGVGEIGPQGTLSEHRPGGVGIVSPSLLATDKGKGIGSSTVAREGETVFCDGATYSPAFGVVWANWLALKRGMDKKGAAREWNTTLRSRLNGDKPEASAARIQKAAAHFAEAMRLEGRGPELVMHCATFLGRDQRWLDFEEWAPTAARASPLPANACAVSSEEAAEFERRVQERSARLRAEREGKEGGDGCA